MTNISLTKQLHTCQLKCVLETIDSVNLCNAAFQRTLPCNDVMIKKKKQASAFQVPVKEIHNATPPHGAYPSHNKEDCSQVLTSASCPTWVFVKKCPSNKLIQSLETVNMSCLESVLPVLLPILQHATDFTPLIHSSSAYH